MKQWQVVEVVLVGFKGGRRWSTSLVYMTDGTCHAALKMVVQ